MSRTAARETTAKLIYQWQLGGEAGLDALHETLETEKLDGEDMQYIEQVLSGVIENVAQLDERILATDNKWKIDRMAKVDLAILRLAIFEMYYREDVPVGAAINEAVNLAKRYGGDQSGKFVNGLLGGIARM